MNCTEKALSLIRSKRRRVTWNFGTAPEQPYSLAGGSRGGWGTRIRPLPRAYYECVYTRILHAIYAHFTAANKYQTLKLASKCIYRLYKSYWCMHWSWSSCAAPLQSQNGIDEHVHYIAIASYIDYITLLKCYHIPGLAPLRHMRQAFITAHKL